MAVLVGRRERQELQEAGYALPRDAATEDELAAKICDAKAAGLLGRLRRGCPGRDLCL